MTHYDPMHDLEEYDPATPREIADDYHLDAPDNPAVGDIQSALALALSQLGPQTFDDNAKWGAVQNILDAMQMLDAYAGVESELQLETVQQEVEAFDGDGMTTVPAEQIQVTTQKR